MESDRIEWNPVESDGIQWSLIESDGILQNLGVFSLKVPRNSTIAGKSVQMHQQLIEQSKNICRNFLIQDLFFLNLEVAD